MNKKLIGHPQEQIKSNIEGKIWSNMVLKNRHQEKVRDFRKPDLVTIDNSISKIF